MAASETVFFLSDLFDDIDLEETYDIDYERDLDVEILDGFYYQNERNVQRLWLNVMLFHLSGKWKTIIP